MPLAAGTRLGPYELLSLLGSGGMGEVYRARDTKLGRDVAIKVLPSGPERLSRFEREGSSASARRKRSRRSLIPTSSQFMIFAVTDGIAYAVRDWLKEKHCSSA